MAIGIGGRKARKLIKRTLVRVFIPMITCLQSLMILLTIGWITTITDRFFTQNTTVRIGLGLPGTRFMTSEYGCGRLFFNKTPEKLFDLGIKYPALFADRR